MIKLIKLFLAFVKADFHILNYLLILLWAGALLILNYTVNLENGVIDFLPTNGLRFLGYFSLYAIAYYGAVFIGVITKTNSSIIKSKRFWLVSASGLIIFSMDSGFVFHQYILNWIGPSSQVYGLLYSCLSNGIEFITIALPLFWVNKFFITNKKERLGVNTLEVDMKPFFLILLLIAPFIFISAYEKGLGSYYPTYKFHSAAEALGVAKWVPVVIYEFLYGMDFFNVELCFRGFFVIGMTTLLGRDALLPMAVLYCSIHFGKPGLEAVSSLFGGYILGAVAYQTRSIWGGVIVHIGLAWMMELAAYLSK